MFKRILQGISQLFADRQPITPHYDQAYSPKLCSIGRSTGGGGANGPGSPTQMPPRPFHNPHHGINGHYHPQRRDELVCHHNASRLLSDGRLQIGITGFHDTAFTIQILGRHDSRELAEAVADLPCRAKMVADRNITEGLERASERLSGSGPGRRGILLITSGDTSVKHAWLQEVAERASAKRIGIHVICLGAKAEDLTCGPQINTKASLGYGGFHVADTQAQLLTAIRDSFEGLIPAFGMTGTNKAVILLDCSETMVESYHGTTRTEMVISSIQEFLNAPLCRNQPVTEKNNRRHNGRSLRSTTLLPRSSSPSFSRDGAYEWAPGSAS